MTELNLEELIEDDDTIGQVYQSASGRWEVSTEELGTLEGTMTGHLGDYLVRGKNDDVWIVQKEIFEDTYSIVDENE